LVGKEEEFFKHKTFDAFRKELRNESLPKQSVVWIPQVSARFMGTVDEHLDTKVTMYMYATMDPVP
jgi:hypothetical protein